MSFVKKTWVDRVSEYPARRNLVKSDGSSEVVTVERHEGTVAVEGDPFNAENMNDLEKRIADALTNIRDAFSLDGTVMTVNFDKLNEVI